MGCRTAWLLQSFLFAASCQQMLEDQKPTSSSLVPPSKSSGLCMGQEFCEDCPDQSKLVRRDASFKDNAALPAQVALRTGDYIYDGLKNGFRVSNLDAAPWFNFGHTKCNALLHQVDAVTQCPSFSQTLRNAHTAWVTCVILKGRLVSSSISIVLMHKPHP